MRGRLTCRPFSTNHNSLLRRNPVTDGGDLPREVRGGQRKGGTRREDNER